MSEDADRIGSRLNALLVEAGMEPLKADLACRFTEFCLLLTRWNSRINLTAIRDEEGILSRHFIESIACARALPAGIGTLLDFGSGAGFPGIPIALCRPEIAVTLAESRAKKAAFLQEAVRVVGISANVYSGRAEMLGRQFGCVTLRAVDKMREAVETGTGLTSPEGWLALMTTAGELEKLKDTTGPAFTWRSPIMLPGSEARLLALAQQTVSLQV
jgi:16S rRNA (guanine527-N7)-methyltransferase